MTPDDVLTVLNFMDQAPSHVPATLRQGGVLVRYAQAGTPAASLIGRDAELLLALAPHGLIGPELLELNLGGRQHPRLQSPAPAQPQSCAGSRG